MAFDPHVSSPEGITAERPPLVVSNREPYVHEWTGDGISCIRPTGGLTAALDGAMGRLSGTWIAWGSGDADFAVADERGRIEVPPDVGDYVLNRVALSPEQVHGYYDGYANQVLWPVCHGEVARVQSEESYWSVYRDVNRAFADAIIDELRSNSPSMIWIHDYHLALVPRFVRDEIDLDAPLDGYWHVPVPTPEEISHCQNAREILDGLFAVDSLGVQTARDRDNLLRCAETVLDGAVVDPESALVEYDGTTTAIAVNPVGIDPDEVDRQVGNRTAGNQAETLLERHSVDADATILLGVDRLDYTKGILERLDAFERLLERHPGLHGEVVLFQKSSPTRGRVPAYKRYRERVEERIRGIRASYETDSWSPIVHVTESLDRPTLYGLYRRADVCVVSSRRDGMNLVAKEFVAASRGGDGVLVCSEFAGAAEELGADAITIDPFDGDSFAESLYRAMTLHPRERGRRLDRLNDVVRDHTVDSWIERSFESAQRATQR